MNTSAQRWKQTQPSSIKKFNSAYKKKKNRGVKRNFLLLLLNEKKKLSIPSVVLQFTGSKICHAMWAVYLNKSIKRVISKKFIIIKKDVKKTFKNVQMIVSPSFKENYIKKWKKINAKKKFPEKNEILKVELKTPPAPVLLSCLHCNHIFTSKKFYDEHMKRSCVTETKVGSDSESDKEMVIDDDVELILNGGCQEPLYSEEKLNLKLKDEDCMFCCMVPECGKIFENEDALNEHVGREHPPNLYDCKICNVIFHKESHLRSHTRMSHQPISKKQPTNHFFTMSPPLATTKSEPLSSSFVKFTRYDNKKSFTCSLCSVEFRDRHILDRHMTVHHISKVYFCFKCHAPFFKLHLLTHLKKAHLKSVNEFGYIQTIADTERVASHRCAFCKFTSKERTRVRDHMNNEHYDLFDKDESPPDEQEEEHISSSPDSLDKLFEQDLLNNPDEESSEDLLVEILNDEPLKKRRKTNDPSFRYRCARCQRRFSRPSHLRDHTCPVRKDKNKESENYRSADPIPKRTSRIQQMQNKFYKCKSCPIVFTDKTMFICHVSTAHSESMPSSSGVHSDSS